MLVACESETGLVGNITHSNHRYIPSLRSNPDRAPSSSWSLAGMLFLLVAYVAGVLTMLGHPYFIADDSAHSYTHVWFLSESLLRRHAWPWHVAQLEGGSAVMFPYGIVPWLPAALLYPLLGDWIVT